METISPLNQLPVSILWGIDNNDVLDIQYRQKWYKVMDIILSKYQLYYIPTLGGGGGPFVSLHEDNSFDKLLWVEDGTDNELEPEEYINNIKKLMQYIKDIYPFDEAVKIIIDYLYGPSYMVYLRMILRKFGDKMKPEDKNGILELIKLL